MAAQARRKEPVRLNAKDLAAIYDALWLHEFVETLDRDLLVALGKAEAERALLRMDVLNRYAASRRADSELSLAVAAEKTAKGKRKGRRS